MNSLPDSHALTLLIAGHRPDRLPGGEVPEHAALALEIVLTRLRDVAEAAQTKLRVLTGASDGVDEYAASLAAKFGLPLHLLSSGMPELLSGAKTSAERIVWFGANDPTAHGGEVIATRDDVALAFADLLLVVWDGETPHGLSGGTVRLALDAALAMKPVIWLGVDGEVRLLDRTRLGGQTLHKLNCPHFETAWLRECFSEPLQDKTLHESLAETLRLTLDPSSAASVHDQHRLADYKKGRNGCKKGQEDQKTGSWAGNFDGAMMALVQGSWKGLRKKFSSWSLQAWFGEDETEEKLKRLLSPTKLLDSRFEYFDIEAKMAAGHHRDLNWLIYCSSSLAVFAAVAGAIGLWPKGHNAFWPVAELFVVGLVIGGVFLAKRRRWHERWIGHRFIAEQIRYARMCMPLLGVPAPLRSPAWQVKVSKTGSKELRLASPEIWFLQRTLAEQGLPVGPDGGSFSACQSGSSAEISGYVRMVIDEQREYHHKKHGIFHEVHERLHVTTTGLFIATAVAVVAHFFIHANWLLICTAFFPALGGAIHGLTTKLEIARIAGQSAETERRLTHLAEAILSTDGHAGWEAWLGLRQMTLESARVMSDENAQWQQLIEHQETGFPA